MKAEDACFGFQPLEYVEVANAWIGLLGNSDQGLALICEAADELNPEELYYLADFAAIVGEQKLANLLTYQGTGYHIEHYLYMELAQQLMSSSNVEAAKRVAKSAERRLETVGDSVAHAKAIIQLFDDQSKAREILKTAEFYCNYTEDYVALAKGFTEVLGEPERTDKLLEEAAQIVMAGEGFAELAYAWLELKNDRGAALAIFRQAVPDIFNRTVLQNIAITAMREFNNPELALQCYQKTADIITPW